MIYVPELGGCDPVSSVSVVARSEFIDDELKIPSYPKRPHTKLAEQDVGRLGMNVEQSYEP